MSAEEKLYALEIADDIWGRAKSAGVAAWNGVKEGGQWIGGALAGEFNTQASVGQILVDAVISMFPIAGEATAARDAIAVSLRMSDSEAEANNKWNWVSLVLCLLAVVPLVGGVVKGVGRLLLRAANDSAKLAEVGRDILAFLHKMGYGDAQAWLKQLDFAKYQGEALNSLNTLFERISQACDFMLRRLGGVLPAGVKSYLQMLPGKLEKLRSLAGRMVPDAIKELNALLNKVRSQIVEGTFIPVQVGAQKEIRVMTEEARIVQRSPIRIASQGHQAAAVTHYKHKEGWPDLRKAINKRYSKNDPRRYKDLATFSRKAPIEPDLLLPGQRFNPPLTRVIDEGKAKKVGRFWSKGLPANGKAWRLNSAVKQEWNKDGKYVALDRLPTEKELKQVLEKLDIPVPEDWQGIRAWRGKAAEQVDNEGAKATGILLPGGETQWLIDFSHPDNAPLMAYIEQLPVKATGWKDAMLPDRVEDVVEYLEQHTRAAKTAADGYVRRGAATIGKQGNNEQRSTP